MATNGTATFRQHRGRLLAGGASKVHHPEADDLPSTAASSVMHSPSGGPACAPQGPEHLDEKVLGHALVDLHEIAEVAEQDAEERARWSQLQRQAAHSDAHSDSDIDIADEDLTVAASLQTPSPRRPVAAWERFVPEVDVADEDLTVAASLEASSPRPRASKEGAPWPCMEWLTAEPCVEAPLLEWLLIEERGAHRPSRRRGRHGQRLQRRGARADGGRPFLASFDSEVAAPPGEETSPTAWARLADDAYASAAGLLRW